MIQKIKQSIAVYAILSCASIAFADGINETLYFIGDDLKTGIKYKNIRYDQAGNLGFIMGKDYDKNKMSYIKPDNFHWTKFNRDGEMQDRLGFENTNNYAFLERIDLKNDLSLQKSKYEKDELFIELDGGACIGTNCLQDENIISVVLPKKFKYSTYEAHEKNGGQYTYNKDANFKLIDNTLTLYAKDMQGAYIKLWFKDVSSSSTIYEDVSDSLSKFTEISVSKSDTETKISMPMDNVFDSGKAQTKSVGKEWLKALAGAIKDKNFKEIRVEGHTDNTPIKGVYPSNWELSSARASDAVRYMIQQGIESSKIAAVGYADTRPISDNSSKENRIKNRRIEITIVGNTDKEASEQPANN